MTIKHMGKSISAEDLTTLCDITVTKNNNNKITSIVLTRKNFHDGEDGTSEDLLDYFYTKQDVDDRIKVHLQVCQTTNNLPAEGQENYIYLVPFSGDSSKDGVYKEFVWIDSSQSYEEVGSTEVDLEPFIQNTDVMDNLTTSTFSSSNPTVLSAHQGYELDQKKIDKTSIATNLSVDDDTKVLSAKQGKALNNNKLDKTHSSYKGKNVVVDNTTGEITFEEKNNHSHTISDIPIASITNGDTTHVPTCDDVYDALDGKSDKGHTHNYAPSVHTHTISDIPTAPVSDGDTDNVPTCDDVYDAITTHSASLDAQTQELLDGLTPINVLVTYTDNSTDTITLLKYEPNSGG